MLSVAKHLYDGRRDPSVAKVTLPQDDKLLSNMKNHTDAAAMVVFTLFQKYNGA